MKGIITGMSVFLAAFLIVFLAAGGGHGSYMPAKVLFPYYILIASVFEGGAFRAVAIVLSIIQMPLYGYLVEKSRRIGISALCLHIVAAILCVRLTPDW